MSDLNKLNNLSEAEQLEAVKLNASDIFNIINPSESVQLAAVQQIPYYIIGIDNPTEKVQLVAANCFNFVDNIKFFIHKITSKEALDLYEKRKKVYKIIK